MLLSKYVVYSLVITSVIGLSLTINHFYSGIVFDDFSVKFSFTLHAMVSLIIFINFNVAIMFLISSLTRNSVIVITVTLINYLILPSILNIFRVLKYTPYRLIESLSLTSFTQTAKISIFLTLGLIILIISLAMIKIKKFELK